MHLVKSVNMKQVCERSDFDKWSMGPLAGVVTKYHMVLTSSSCEMCDQNNAIFHKGFIKDIFITHFSATTCTVIVTSCKQEVDFEWSENDLGKHCMRPLADVV